MENQITCPNCNKKYADNPVIEDAAAGKGSAMQFIICECGERMTYWQITAQLREQNTFSHKFKVWFHSLSHSQA
jgi:hypothetical protein